MNSSVLGGLPPECCGFVELVGNIGGVRANLCHKRVGDSRVERCKLSGGEWGFVDLIFGKPPAFAISCPSARVFETPCAFEGVACIVGRVLHNQVIVHCWSFRACIVGWVVLGVTWHTSPIFPIATEVGGCGLHARVDKGFVGELVERASLVRDFAFDRVNVGLVSGDLLNLG